MPKHDKTPLDRAFSALSDATRRDVVRRLAAHGREPIADLAACYDLAFQSFVEHVRVLERAGLVVREKDGRSNFLSLRREAIVPIRSWLASLPAAESETAAGAVAMVPAAATATLLVQATGFAADVAPRMRIVARALAIATEPASMQRPFQEGQAPDPNEWAASRLAEVVRAVPALAAELEAAVALHEQLARQVEAARADAAAVTALRETVLPLSRKLFTWRGHPLLRDAFPEELA